MLSSPSGAGKTTISKMLLKKDKSISIYIIPRGLKEKEKVKDYIFLSDKEFNKVSQNKLLDAKVFGYRYGTLKQTVNNF